MNNIIKDISDFIFISDKPEKADVIVIAGGSFPEPAETAARLLEENFAPYIVIGGGVDIGCGKLQPQLLKKSESEMFFYREMLSYLGIANSRIRHDFPFSCKKALLVCKAYHARRSLLSYRSIFPDIEFFIVPYQGSYMNKSNWHTSKRGISQVLGEVEKCGGLFDTSEIERCLK